jgi:hypothetical protein
MTESLIAETEGSGKNRHSWQRTIEANDVEDTFVLLAEPANPTFSVIASSIATTTSASHLLFIQGDGTNYTRIKRIYVEHVVGAGSATLAQLQILRTTTAGSGGTSKTAYGFDGADTYAGTIQTLPSSKGTEGDLLLQKRLWLTNTIAAQPVSWEWQALLSDARKPIIIGPATTDGICLKIVTGIATSTLDISVTFTVDSSL